MQQGNSIDVACSRVAGEFPAICGACDCGRGLPETWPSLVRSPFPTFVDPPSCGCAACTDSIWLSTADSFTCGARINWVVQQGNSIDVACSTVAGEFPSICGACRCGGSDTSLSLVPSPYPTFIDPPACGCAACTDSIWTSTADGFTCGARINWVVQQGNRIEVACSTVAGEFPSICGACGCGRPDARASLAPSPSPSSLPSVAPSQIPCGCDSCTEAVWIADADGFSCGSRVNWLIEQGSSPDIACARIAFEFPTICGLRGCSSPTPAPSFAGGLPDEVSSQPSFAPSQIPCGCDSCTEAVWIAIADGATCGFRINWLIQQGNDSSVACSTVAGEFPTICGLCGCSPSPAPSSMAGLPEEVSSLPSMKPSREPSALPSSSPTWLQSSVPTARPTNPPSFNPSSSPSRAPTTKPTSVPTEVHSSVPTSSPTFILIAGPGSVTAITVPQFFIAYNVFGMTVSPSNVDYEQLRLASTLFLDQLLAASYGNAQSFAFLQTEIQMTNRQFSTGFPAQRFNVLVEFAVTASFQVVQGGGNSIPTSDVVLGQILGLEKQEYIDFLQVISAFAFTSEIEVGIMIIPSAQPSPGPSTVPSEVSSSQPTNVPTPGPSEWPSVPPSKGPTSSPTDSAIPSSVPSLAPSGSVLPSASLSNGPSQLPSLPPSNLPSVFIDTKTGQEAVSLDVPEFFLAYSVSGLNRAPSNLGYQELLLVTELYLDELLAATYGDVGGGQSPAFLDVTITMSYRQFEADIPAQRFNVYAQCEVTASFETEVQQQSSVPTSDDVLQTILASDMEEYKDFVRTVGVFLTTIEVTLGAFVSPSEQPSVVPTTDGSPEPTSIPSDEPSVLPTGSMIPSSGPSARPSDAPTIETSHVPTITLLPSLAPTGPPTGMPSITSPPSDVASSWPSSQREQQIMDKCAMTQERRSDLLLFTLQSVSNVSLMTLESSAQNQAFTWIDEVDESVVCPGEKDGTIAQRYAVAVLYFSLNGPGWSQCGLSSGQCADGSSWLSASSECD